MCHQFTPDSREAWITLGPGWNQGGLIVLDLASGTLVPQAAFDPAVVKANCGLSVTEDRALANWCGRVVAGDDSDGEWYVFDRGTKELLDTRPSGGPRRARAAAHPRRVELLAGQPQLRTTRS